jgi:hypothetical protein
MRWQISSIGVALFLLSVSASLGQSKQSKSRPSKASVVCPIFIEKGYPYQGIGVKLGDPFALTYKFYPSRHFAFSLDAGKASSNLYNKYYDKVFPSYVPDTLESTATVQHLFHKVVSDVFLEGKLLYQWDAQKLSKGLQFYTGLGWQWHSANIQYTYLYRNSSPGSTIVGDIKRNRFTYGLVGIVGFEYANFSIPISAFIEVEYFSDLLIDKGYHRFQGGVGLRYVF